MSWNKGAEAEQKVIDKSFTDAMTWRKLISSSHKKEEYGPIIGLLFTDYVVGSHKTIKEVDTTLNGIRQLWTLAREELRSHSTL